MGFFVILLLLFLLLVFALLQLLLLLPLPLRAKHEDAVVSFVLLWLGVVLAYLRLLSHRGLQTGKLGKLNGASAGGGGY